MKNIVEIPVVIKPIAVNYGKAYVVENAALSDILVLENELISCGQPFFIVPIYSGDADFVPDFSEVKSRNIVKPTFYNGDLSFKFLHAVGDKFLRSNRMTGYEVVAVRNLSKRG